MNTEENKFNNALNSKLDSYEHSFDEANWDKAQLLLNNRNAGRKRGFWFFITGIMALVGGAFYMLFTGSPFPNVNDEAINDTLASKKTNEVAAIIKQKNVQNSNNKNNLPQNSATSTNDYVAPNKDESKPFTQFKSNVKTNDKNATTIIKAIAKLERQAPEKVTTTKSNKIKTNTNSVNKITSTLLTSNNNIVKANKQRIDVEEVLTKNNNNSSNEALHGNVEPNTIALPTINNPNNNTPTSAPIAITDTTTNAAIKSTLSTLATTPLTTTILPDRLQPKLPITAPITKTIKNFIWIEAGANYMLGWKNNLNTNEGKALSPIVGLNYTHYITNKVFATVGAQYATITKLNNSEYKTVATKYSFGEQLDVTSIVPIRLNYAVMPIRAGFDINASNSISAGVNIAYLLNAPAKATTYSQNYAGESARSTSKPINYANGFNAMDIQLALNYRVRIIKELRLNAQIYYGLKDVKDNSFYNSNVTENNTGAKLTLSYTFLKF
jgi:hypothetical protein